MREMVMPFKKIVQRIPISDSDPITDLVALIDVIELYLGIGTGERSAHDRLAATVAEIRHAGGIVDAANLETLLDVVDRLGKVEVLLAASGFETKG
jgi:hypothetical protein